MTSKDPKSKFLELESQAGNLIQTLENIQSEANNYKMATQTINSVSDQIKPLLDTMLTASQGLNLAISGLREIGTAEVLNDLQRIQTEVDALNTSFISFVSELNESIGSIAPSIKKLPKEINDNIVQTLDSTMTKISDNIEESSASTIDQISNNIEESSTSTIDQISSRLTVLESKMTEINNKTNQSLLLRLLTFR